MRINELESEQKDWALSMLCRSGVLSLDLPLYFQTPVIT